MSYRDIPEAERRKLTYQLFTSPGWAAMAIILEDRDSEALESVRDRTMEPSEHIGTLRFTEKLRGLIRTTALASGVKDDPFA